MVRLEAWMNIHALHKQGLSYPEIGRLTGRDWRTVKEALSRDGVPRYARAVRGSRLDAYTGYVDQALCRGVARASRLYREIKAQGYTGGYELVKCYVREQKRLRIHQAVMHDAAVRSATRSHFFILPPTTGSCPEPAGRIVHRPRARPNGWSVLYTTIFLSEPPLSIWRI